MTCSLTGNSPSVLPRLGAWQGQKGVRAGTPAPADHLHVGIVGPTTAFRCNPLDILCRVLDVAGLAVHTILGVDLEPLATVSLLHDFVHPRRTVALSGLIKHGQ